jgi:thiamine pyrophosphate-dependent acetolactate synthase large subunit-like protein
MNQHSGCFALIEQLLADGITCMFGNPGTAEQGFLDAISSFPQFNYILCLQEAVAVAAADGYGRATQKPAVVQLHAGVGLGNGIGMMYQAMRGHSPLLILAGEAGIRFDALEAQMSADLVSMARPVTKWATRVVDPSSLLRVIRRAVKVAATPPMGPVFVSLPGDIMEKANNEKVVPTSIPQTRTAPPPDLISGAVELLKDAQCPLILMGDGIAASGAQVELGRTAEILGAEVWGAESSEVNLSYRHPLFCGLLGHVFGSLSCQITSRADAVLIAGTYVFPEVYPYLEGMFAPNAKIIQIDLNAYDIAKNFPIDLGLVSDPKLTLSALNNALEMEMTPLQKELAADRSAKISTEKQRLLAAEIKIDAARHDAVPLNPACFMEHLAAQLPENAVVFDEGLTCSNDLLRYLQPHLAGHYFQTREGSLGVGFPGALGLKLAYPNQTVVGISGDGASLFTFQTLWTAAHYRIPVKFVICNNHSYKLLKVNVHQYWHEQNMGEHPFPPFFDLVDPVIDFVGLAQALGVAGMRIERPEQIAPGVRKMLESDKPYLLDVVISGN